MEDQDQDQERRYSCITCRLFMDDQQAHVAHHKSDFHRFNLKRKMINLPPVSIDQFQMKVAELQPKAPESASIIECRVCKKEFKHENTYIAHTNSNKHKEALAAAIERGANPDSKKIKQVKPKHAPQSSQTTTTSENAKEDTEASTEEADAPAKKTVQELIEEKLKTSRKIKLEECMFCLKLFENLESNVEHMEYEHGFFIPDREYLTDLPGLIEYLGEKLSLGNICLWCNQKSPHFRSLQAVQRHMDSLGHCKLAYEPEDEDEYAEFYEFPSSSTALIQSTVSDTASSEFQLVFTDGFAIGHRSLARYYRQRFRPSESRAAVLANQGVNDFKLANWYRDAAQQDKMRQAEEYARVRNRKDMELGVRDNFLFRFRKDNVTTRNSGR